MTADVALCTNQPRGSSSGSSGSVVAPNSEKDSFVQTKPHRALDFSLPPSVKADVVVVGAGLSGLRAASLLKRLGYSVLVLEASERVGGRLKPFVDSDGITWDVGGQWVGPQQHRMHKLLQEYAIGTVSQYDDSQGKLVIVNEGERIELVRPRPCVQWVYINSCTCTNFLVFPNQVRRRVWRVSNCCIFECFCFARNTE